MPGRSIYGAPYIAADRVALATHPAWPAAHPERAWNPTRDISFYLAEIYRQLGAALVDIVSRVRGRAPEASVVVVDYLTILPADLARLTGKPTPEVAAWGVDAASRLSAAFAAAAVGVGCDFLPVGEASREHHAWATEPWTRRFHFSLGGGAPYHPNDDGMAAVARMLNAAIAR